MPDKAKEHFYFSALRGAMPSLLEGPAIPSETPDFLIVMPGRIVGVEFTLFSLPANAPEKSHQEVQAMKERTVARAERLHAERGGPALYVSVFFHPRSFIDKRSVHRVAHGISEAVARAAALAARNVDVDVPWRDLPQEVAHISVRRSIDGTDKLWHADAGGWVADVLPQHIRQVLRMKAAMQSRARTRCDELWLVIVNDLFSRAAQAELGLHTGGASFDHSFDRLLWLIPHVPRVVALNASA